MPVLMNKLNRKRLIQVSENRSIVLLAKGTATVSPEEVKLPIINELKEKGEVIVMGDVKVKKERNPMPMIKDKE